MIQMDPNSLGNQLGTQTDGKGKSPIRKAYETSRGRRSFKVRRTGKDEAQSRSEQDKGISYEAFPTVSTRTA